MHRQDSIFGGTLLLTGTNLLLRVISIGFNVFLAARIGAAGLGLLQLISAVGGFAILVGTSGIRTSAMVLAAEEFGHGRPDGVRAAVSICLRGGLLIAIPVGCVLFFFAETLAVGWLRDTRAVLSLEVMGLLLPFTCLCGIMTGYYTACARIRQLVLIEIGERLVSLFLTLALLLTWAGDDLSRACFAVTFGNSVGCIFDFSLLYVSYRRDVRSVAPPTKSLDLPRRLLRLTVPLALNDYLRAGLTTAEQLLIPIGLARFGGSTEQAMADYGTIHAMVFPILMFPAAVLYSVSDLLVPELSRSQAMGRRERITDLTDKCMRIGLLFAGGVSGFLLLNADALGMLIYHSSEAGYYLKIFAPMVLMLYLDAIVDGMLKGLAEQVRCVRYNTFTSLLDVLLLFLLLPRLGIGGYVFSFALTHAVNLFLSVRRLLTVARHRPRSVDFLRPTLAALLAAVVILLFPAPNTGMLLSILTRGGAYLCLMFAFDLLGGALTRTDVRWLRRVVRHSTRHFRN